MASTTWIQFDSFALQDGRIKLLAKRLGCSHADAIVACINVWVALYEQGGGLMEPDKIDAVSGHEGMAEKMLSSHLAEAHESGVRIKGDKRAEGMAEVVVARKVRGTTAAKRRHRSVKKLGYDGSLPLLNSGSDSSVLQQLSTETVVGSTNDDRHASKISKSSLSSLVPEIDSGSGFPSGSALSTASASPGGAAAKPKAPKAPKLKPPRKPPDQFEMTVRTVTDYWSSVWLERATAAYQWTEDDFHAMRSQVKKHGPGEVKARIVAFLRNTPESVKRWLQDSAPTVKAFVATWNSLTPWNPNRVTEKIRDENDASVLVDHGWKQKSGLRFSELRALADRKVPAWWSDPERIEMVRDAHDDPVIPLKKPGVPVNHDHVLKRLRDYIAGDKTKQRDVDAVVAWYRKRFNLDEVAA